MPVQTYARRDVAMLRLYPRGVNEYLVCTQKVSAGAAPTPPLFGRGSPNRYRLTTIACTLFSGELAVVDQFDQADEILLPSIVLGELVFGARKSSRASENLARIEDLSRQVVVLDCDSDTARQYHLTLITRDTHFAEIDDLPSETW